MLCGTFGGILAEVYSSESEFLKELARATSSVDDSEFCREAEDCVNDHDAQNCEDSSDSKLDEDISEAEIRSEKFETRESPRS
ncbi:hypothetical protein BaRGS_00025082 [Batillaria attramentaria]|uniref:Uncharacterized protein n=1 Tax=Batillaria attramentaria TaxID=370345 RepID=A0ABD0K981_9CAEN